MPLHPVLPVGNPFLVELFILGYQKVTLWVQFVAGIKETWG